MRSRPIRLLMINRVVGSESKAFITWWCHALARKVDSLCILTMEKTRIELPPNVRVYSAGKERGYGRLRRALEFSRRLSRILKIENINICFCHMLPIFPVIAAPLLKPRRIPIVTWYSHRQVTNLLKLAHRLSDRIVTSSDSSYQYSKDKVVVVGHGIDTETFHPQPDREETPPLVLCVGRLSPIKDLTTLLEAVGLARQRGCDLRCALVGAPPERDLAYARKLRERIRQLGLQDTIEVVGAVPQRDVVDWYRRCAVHVNLSPKGALDKAALEAMACARPSLVANEGFRETLADWSPRLLFRHGDPEALAGKLWQVLELGARERRAMAEALRRSVVDHHSLEGLADRLTKLFTELLEHG